MDRLSKEVFDKFSSKEFKELVTQRVIDFYYLRSQLFHQLGDLTARSSKSQVNQLKTCFLGEGEYPNLLVQLPDPPKLLFGIGDWSLLKRRDAIAVVGTRKVHESSLQFLNLFLNDIGRYKVLLVSGLADGVDRAAHEKYLSLGLPQIAVLPFEISLLSHSAQDLARAIIKAGGLIVWEYFSDSITAKYKYVLRNRIIAGLAPVTIVIEAPSKSGALHTARFAFDYNREVYAGMCDIYSESNAGNLMLLEQDLAYPLTKNYKGILAALGVSMDEQVGLFPERYNEKVTITKRTDLEQEIMKNILALPSSVSSIIDSCANYSAAEIQAALLNLEYYGVIYRDEYGRYHEKTIR